VVVALALTAGVIANSVLFVWPPSDRPAPVDAILSLNGTNETARQDRAISLAEEGYAPVLLFSKGTYVTNCPEVPKVKVVCFVPVPGRTAGEVEFAARYLHAHGLHSILIVSGRTQAFRAKMLMGRCFSGRTLVVPAPEPISHLPFEVAYEWAAMGRALIVDRTC
jgi:hypothetical protein